jgi:hypothetical protein
MQILCHENCSHAKAMCAQLRGLEDTHEQICSYCRVKPEAARLPYQIQNPPLLLKFFPSF